MILMRFASHDGEQCRSARRGWWKLLQIDDSISKTNPEIFDEIFRINSFSSLTHARSTGQLHYKLAGSLVYSLCRAKRYNDRNTESQKLNVCSRVKCISLCIIYYVSYYRPSDNLLIRCAVFDIIRVGKKNDHFGR